MPESFATGAGDDSIDGGALADALGRDANRIVYGSASSGVNVNLAGTVSGGSGADTLANIDQVQGSSHADTLTGTDRSDRIEMFWGRGGVDLIDGRGGIDWLRFDGVSALPVTASLATNTVSNDGFSQSETIAGFEGLVGSSFADSLTGSNRSDLIEFFAGMGGNDTINGLGGPDRVGYEFATSGIVLSFSAPASATATDGDNGTDTLLAIEAVLRSPFAHRITGSSGAERFEGGAGADTLDGGAGIDTAEYSAARSGGVVVNLLLGSASADGHGSSDMLLNFEQDYPNSPDNGDRDRCHLLRCRHLIASRPGSRHRNPASWCHPARNLSGYSTGAYRSAPRRCRCSASGIRFSERKRHFCPSLRRYWNEIHWAIARCH